MTLQIETVPEIDTRLNAAAEKKRGSKNAKTLGSSASWKATETILNLGANATKNEFHKRRRELARVLILGVCAAGLTTNAAEIKVPVTLTPRRKKR